MRDFTLSAYELLLTSLQARGYKFLTFEEFLTSEQKGKQIIVRHDVDDLPQNSLNTAILEKALGIKSSYYFRIVKQSNHPDVIKAIAELGHEIGYHYEDLALTKGDVPKALADFEKNLQYFRQYYPVKTICMHGSPLSRWDNRKLWEHASYRDYGIIGEPYFEIDFSKFFYLTDTGRRWNGEKVSVRDKVESFHKLEFRSTFDIVAGINQLPDQIMITTHPQRWENNLLPWIKELVLQNTKNQIKRLIAS
ncbi:MAG TPA: hypothetical protein VGO45_03195 [Bacteroidia bacterium]|jgi:hypothetical protein|nr:hypothetical protein [Bacteroidia bacterium]